MILTHRNILKDMNNFKRERIINLIANLLLQDKVHNRSKPYLEFLK